MKPENRALVTLVVAVAAVTGVVGGYLLLGSSGLPATLPVPAGVLFNTNATQQWAGHFTVGPSWGRLVGAWTAYSGIGFVTLLVVNGTVDKPSQPTPRYCPFLIAWTEQNGTIDRVLAPGPYTVYWSTGFCASASRIVVTQTIQLQGL